MNECDCLDTFLVAIYKYKAPTAFLISLNICKYCGNAFFGRSKDRLHFYATGEEMRSVIAGWFSHRLEADRSIYKQYFRYD